MPEFRLPFIRISAKKIPTVGKEFWLFFYYSLDYCFFHIFLPKNNGVLWQYFRIIKNMLWFSYRFKNESLFINIFFWKVYTARKVNIKKLIRNWYYQL